MQKMIIYFIFLLIIEFKNKNNSSPLSRTISIIAKILFWDPGIVWLSLHYCQLIPEFKYIVWYILIEFHIVRKVNLKDISKIQIFIE